MTTPRASRRRRWLTGIGITLGVMVVVVGVIYYFTFGFLPWRMGQKSSPALREMQADPMATATWPHARLTSTGDTPKYTGTRAGPLFGGPPTSLVNRAFDVDGTITSQQLLATMKARAVEDGWVIDPATETSGEVEAHKTMSFGQATLHLVLDHEPGKSADVLLGIEPTTANV